MKRLVYLFLMLCLMAGCTHTSRHPQLVAVDSLLASQPDSALALLRQQLPSLGGTEGGSSTADRMYYYLLLGDACNKCYDTLPSDSIMHEVADFYDAHGTANEQVRAHYLLGCVYRDEGNAPLALKHYRDAVDCSDTTATECDFGTLSRIYGQMADLFHQQYAPRLQLEAQRKAVDYAWRAKDTLAAVIFYSRLGSPYHMMNMIDSVLYHNQLAIDLFYKYHYYQYASSLQLINIDILLNRNENDKAKDLILEYEKNALLTESGNIIEGAEIFYYYKGLYYDNKNKLDSALLYYRKLQLYSDNLNNAEAVYKGLLSVYQKLGIADSVRKYAILYCHYNDSAIFVHSANEITRMQSLYNYDASERKAIQHKKEANTYRQIIYAIVFAVLLTCYLIYRFVKRQKRKKMQELAQANTAYSALLSQYSQMQNDLSAAQQGFDNYRIEKEKAIQQLQQELSSYQEDAEQQKKWDASQAMLHDAIVIHLHKMASKACKATEEEWQSLNQFAIKNMSAFLDKVCDEEINLTEKEIRVCILTRLQFIPTEMAVLLNLSKQRVTNIKANANKKLFNKAGAQTFDTNINSYSEETKNV